MPTRNINLTEHLDQFVQDRITSGRYGNASEIVREGLRVLELREKEEQAKLERLHQAAQEGFDEIDRGESTELRSIERLERHIDRIGKHASAELRSRRGRA
jgi:antitoxin ParD1/3/4